MVKTLTKTSNTSRGKPHFARAAALLAQLGREFHSRGWVLGTSGNFSAVLSRKPLRLAVTPTGVDKSVLTSRQILQVDSAGKPLRGSAGASSGGSSAETPLHLTIVEVRRAGAVLHTHSLWSTLLSSHYAARGGLTIEGYEMLKGLEGVHTHEHREWLPILDNLQEMPALANQVKLTLKGHPGCHAFLLRGHGLYTWGRDVPEAKRHVEILEFLMEVVGRDLFTKGFLPGENRRRATKSGRGGAGRLKGGAYGVRTNSR